MAEEQVQESSNEEAQVQETDEQAQQESSSSAPEQQAVPMEALREEREKRKLLEQELEFYRRQQLQQEPEVRRDPDEILTMHELDQILEERLSPVQKQMRQEKLLAQLEAAKKANPDFDEVIAFADNVLTQDQVSLIEASKNPAEMAYWIGKNHPLYKPKASTRAEKVDKTSGKPATLSDMGGGAVSSEEIDWSKASPETFKKRRYELFGY